MTAPEQPTPTRKRYGDPVRNARLDDALWQRTRAAAERDGVTASDIIRDALQLHLDTLDAQHA